jgi:cob(I)alamin adenosyltransferase
MKIYTKTGDAGDTGLFGGGRVGKDHPRVEAYGDVDELNATLGLVRALEPMPRIDEIIVPIQRDLFSIGALLATPDREKMRASLEKARIDDANSSRPSTSARRSSNRCGASSCLVERPRRRRCTSRVRYAVAPNGGSLLCSAPRSCRRWS